jgi:hypothetical protein
MQIAPKSTHRVIFRNIFSIFLLFSATTGLLTSCSDADNENSNGLFDIDGNCSQNGTENEIQNVHTPNHIFTITSDDLNTGIPKSYVLDDNGSGHTHTVNVNADHFTTLRNNVGLRLTSSTDAGHNHLIIVSCR